MAAKKHNPTDEQLSLTFSAPEEWRDILGFEGLYQVSDLGRVRSLTRAEASGNQWGRHMMTRPGRLLSLSPNQRGYCVVMLSKAGVVRHHMVHTLVLETFRGPRPDGHMCNHLDCDGTNNALSNLEWVTPQGNMTHMVLLGRSLLGEKNHMARLTGTDVKTIRRMYAAGMSYEQIAGDIGVNRRTIRDVILQRTWKHVP